LTCVYEKQSQEKQKLKKQLKNAQQQVQNTLQLKKVQAEAGEQQIAELEREMFE